MVMWQPDPSFYPSPRQAAKAKQYVALADDFTVLRFALDLDLGIERPEEGLGDRQPGDDDLLAASHDPAEPCLGRYHRRRSDVAMIAQILSQRRRDEGGKIEAVEGEGHRRPPISRVRKAWRSAARVASSVRSAPTDWPPSRYSRK